MKQTLEEFIEAYKQQAGPICRDLWDDKDTEYVASLWTLHPRTMNPGE